MNNRRKYFQTAFQMAGMFSLGAMSYPVYRYLSSPSQDALGGTGLSFIRLSDAQLLEPGQALRFSFNRKPAILIHHEDGQWVSFSAVCTHLSCTVKYEPDKQRVFCACHEGVFDPFSGEVVSGPPPRGLDVFRVKVEDDAVVVSIS